MFPFDYIADVVDPRSEDHKLITHVISFELTQHVAYSHGTLTLRKDRQTDGQKDDLR